MKIALAIETGEGLEALICPTFGRAPQFLVFDTKDESISIHENKAAQNSQGAGTGAAAFIIKIDAQAIVAGRFGPKAYDVLSQSNVATYEMPQGTTVKGALEQIQRDLMEP